MKIRASTIVLSVPGVPVEALMLRTLTLVVLVPPRKPRAVVRPVRKRSR